MWWICSAAMRSILRSVVGYSMSIPRCLLDTVPILGTKDIPTTILRAAIAGLCGFVIDLIPESSRYLTFCYRSVRRAGKSTLGFLFIDHIPQGTCQERTLTRMMSHGVTRVCGLTEEIFARALRRPTERSVRRITLERRRD